MNCDQVFDILTRGPFPTGNSCDDSVERHLSHCGGCRRLAEALQPALELIEESVEPEEGRNLPTYWGALLDDAGEEWMSSSGKIGGPDYDEHSRPLADRSARRLLWPTLSGIAAAVAVGLLIGAALGRINLTEPSNKFPSGALAAATAESRDRPVSTWTVADSLEHHNLSLACFDSSNPTAWNRAVDEQADRHVTRAQLQWSDLACCTECHRSGGDAERPPLATKIAMSCQQCHVQ